MFLEYIFSQNSMFTSFFKLKTPRHRFAWGDLPPPFNSRNKRPLKKCFEGVDNLVHFFARLFEISRKRTPFLAKCRLGVLGGVGVPLEVVVLKAEDCAVRKKAR